MKLINKSLIEIKKSKFYGYLYEINTKEDIEEILNTLKKEHKGYRHIPYAYKLINSNAEYGDMLKETMMNTYYNSLSI